MFSYSGASTARQQALFTQYITLMLIVLSFVVGSFALRRLAPSGAPVRSAEAVANLPALPARDEIVLPDLFAAGRSTVNQARGGALAELLLSHDLYVEVELEAPDDSSGLTLALDRSHALLNFLEPRGVPPDAVAVFVRSSGRRGGGLGSETAGIRIFREGR